ncbi:C-type lectin domain family 4 member F-like [Dreissena polymorpha]|uniref:C-type lectin domain-containing protein n=1 Tax=Dreissena polymorpha TaxID=45954 RepID=A0A9D4RT45_DREPO|nr:C-type lectin domain family 4 member F-like [Dreissena polymorpha]KAH3877798.1 hypothetical protein DPMN_001676 [Dreissena polymorpha]
MTWNDAEYHCKANGGQLAYITSQAEEDFMMNFMKKERLNQYGWIGLSDQGKEGSWSWTSGYPFSWAKWFPFRYNSDKHNSEDCVALVPAIDVIFGIHANGAWDDLHCEALNPSLCRYDANQTAAALVNDLLGLLSNLGHSIFG